MSSKTIRVHLDAEQRSELSIMRGVGFKENSGARYRLTIEEAMNLGVSNGKDTHGNIVPQDPLPEEKESMTESSDGVILTYLGGRPLKSKEDAVRHFKIDLNKYTIDKFECKAWSTSMKVKREGKAMGFDVVQVQNYGVTVKLLRACPELLWKNIKYKKRSVAKRKGSKLGWGVIPLGDFHAGAFTADLQRTQDFNIGILAGYLEEIAKEVNGKQYKKVYLCLLGDFIESFTGLNHINSWKGLDKNAYGINGLIMTHELLSKHLYSKIDNLELVDFVPGNHDRVTSNNKEDVLGEVAYALQYLFQKDYSSIESEVFQSVSKRILDGIGYLGMHGHLGLSKKDTGKIVQDYGFSEAEYHVVMQGHTHARETKKTLKKKIAVYEDIIVVQHDSLDYRKITVAPLFTGNLYSENMGFSSTAGMCHLYKDHRGKIRHEDVTI
tara:strand:- start:3021 stop:4334 length:1314 start_codon:yes stop_codon:yes gene_type:complete